MLETNNSFPNYYTTLANHFSTTIIDSGRNDDVWNTYSQNNIENQLRTHCSFAE